MSSSEMYMAFQRGTVDGGTTGMPAAVSRKVFEVQKYMTIANYTTAQFVIQANLEWWNKLPTGSERRRHEGGQGRREGNGSAAPLRSPKPMPKRSSGTPRSKSM